MVALVAFAAMAALQASCVAAFGVDEVDRRNAIQDLCACPDLKYLGASCEGTLTLRMDGASTTLQGAWLANYMKHCSRCESPFLCLSESPTCSVDACVSNDDECCTVPGTGKLKCVKGSCQKPQ
jgi:hypothetical protein